MKAAAFDIGGANIKAADSEAHAFSVPFALWRTPEELSGALRGVLLRLLPADVLAVTMTGELCDSFETKDDGVRHILGSTLDALAAACGSDTPPPAFVWTTEGTWVRVEKDAPPPSTAAAANWLALALFACRYAGEDPALLVDVGSTTTDIVPLRGGAPTPAGRSDTSRLQARELVYTGVTRTPIGMLRRRLPYRGELCPVAAELFATTLDAYVLLEDLPEALTCTDTADGRPADRKHARERLARMVCADRTTFSEEDALTAARAVRSTQEQLVEEALDDVIARLGARPSTVVVSGTGEFLVRELAASVSSRVISLADELGPDRSAAACAVALAELTRERWPEPGTRRET